MDISIKKALHMVAPYIANKVYHVRTFKANE